MSALRDASAMHCQHVAGGQFIDTGIELDTAVDKF